MTTPIATTDERAVIAKQAWLQARRECQAAEKHLKGTRRAYFELIGHDPQFAGAIDCQGRGHDDYCNCSAHCVLRAARWTTGPDAGLPVP